MQEYGSVFIGTLGTGNKQGLMHQGVLPTARAMCAGIHFYRAEFVRYFVLLKVDKLTTMK